MRLVYPPLENPASCSATAWPQPEKSFSRADLGPDIHSLAGRPLNANIYTSQGQIEPYREQLGP